jgi:hypothetical protein
LVGVVFSGYIVHTQGCSKHVTRVEPLNDEGNYFCFESKKAVLALLVIGTQGRVNLYWLVFSGLGFGGSGLGVGLLHPQGNTLITVILMHLYSIRVILVLSKFGTSNATLVELGSKSYKLGMFKYGIFTWIFILKATVIPILMKN